MTNISPEINKGCVWACSIDIGSKNFCWYIEEYNEEEIKKIIPLSKSLRYKEDSSTTPDMEKLLEKIYKNGKVISHVNSDITEGCVRKGKVLDPNTFHNLTDLFDSYADYFNKCSFIVIEQQMSFKNKFNFMALKVGQHCFSYFMLRYGRFKYVVEFPAYYKTQILGAAKKPGVKCKNGKMKWKAVDKPARKKWAVVKYTDIMLSKGQVVETHTMGTKGRKIKIKNDDLADTYLQLQAWKYLYYVDKIYSDFYI